MPMSIAENIARIEEEIAAACRRVGRARETVRLMAVSKTHPPESILAAYSAGQRLFGENRVQEFAGKREALLADTPLASFDCIGPVQSNKAARTVEVFDAIDTVDSLRLAERLDQAAEKTGKTLPIYIEIKLSPEPNKHGFAPESAELRQLLERLPDLAHLQPRGLMTIPPFAEDPEQARPYFRQLRVLGDSLARRHPRVALNELSMGMSHDFAIAIEEGATVVRVGTAIFGVRHLRSN